MSVKVSVIVPCYNVEPWLDRGLLSLVNQSLRDIEIICIDDKSVDNTLEILRKWEKNDLRIRVVAQKKNRGVAVARNLGIDMATGEYIGFMDPDDYVSMDFYEKLVAAAEKEKAQVACGSILTTDMDGKKTLNAWRSMRSMKKSVHNFIYHHTAIYRSDFLKENNIRYGELVINEDVMFEAQVKCAMTTHIALVPNVKYFYCRRENSIYSTYFPEAKIRDFVVANSWIIDLYNSAPVPRDGYIFSAHRVFASFYDVAMPRNVTMRPFLAQAMCDIFPRLKYKEAFKKRNLLLYVALMNNDPNGVLEVYNGQRRYARTYRLFGRIKCLTVSYNATMRVVRIFGIPIYTREMKINF